MEITRGKKKCRRFRERRGVGKKDSEKARATARSKAPASVPSSS